MFDHTGFNFDEKDKEEEGTSMVGAEGNINASAAGSREQTLKKQNSSNAGMNQH